MKCNLLLSLAHVIIKKQYSGDKKLIDSDRHDESQHLGDKVFPSASVITNVASTDSCSEILKGWDTCVNRN